MVQPFNARLTCRVPRRGTIAGAATGGARPAFLTFRFVLVALALGQTAFLEACKRDDSVAALEKERATTTKEKERELELPAGPPIVGWGALPGEVSKLVAYADGSVYFRRGSVWFVGFVPASHVQDCVQSLEDLGFFTWDGRRPGLIVDGLASTLWARSHGGLASFVSNHEHHTVSAIASPDSGGGRYPPEFISIWERSKEVMRRLVPEKSSPYRGEVRELRKEIPG